MKVDLEKFKKKLRRYEEKDIVMSSHSEIRALFRNIDLEEVKKNIINPDRLVGVIEDEERSRYECYFSYSKTHCHKYILVLNSKVIIVTIININRKWQRMLR